jgi:hypothetical protein
MSEDNPYAPPEYPPPTGSALPLPTDDWGPPPGHDSQGEIATQPVGGVVTEVVKVTRPTNAAAKRAFILGACSFILTPVVGVAAVILGRRARAEIAQTGDGGEGLASAGAWMGGAFSLLWFLGAAFLIAVQMGSIAS